MEISMYDRDPLDQLLERLPEPHRHRRIGRNQAQLAVLFRALSIGHTANAAAALAGLSNTTVKRWRRTDREFQNQFEAARALGREALAKQRIADSAGIAQSS